MYKKTISIEKQLHTIANDNPEYGELWSTWNLNKKTLEPILNTIIKDYPHYSFHDNSHSESILLNIEKVLGNENIEKLSPTDLWLLLHVAYFHDFGMVVLESKIHDFWTSPDFQNFLEEQYKGNDEEFKKAAETILFDDKNKQHFQNSWPLEVKSAVTLLTSKYCRWQHGDFSKNYVLDINDIWGIDIGHNGLIKKRLVSLIAEISAMHTKPFNDLYKLHKIANGFRGDYVHPRLIGSLLRLGDVLDLDNGRFNQYGEKIFGKMPNDSKVHYEKHESTKHVLISEEWIEVEADCPTDAVYRETRRWYDSLKNEIELMHLNWGEIATKEFTHPPRLAPYKILRNGIEDSNELSNLKFNISQNKAFEILEGASIYKDKFSCIREIVQNAEDATKIQLWRDIQNGLYYCKGGIVKSKVDDGTLLPSDIPEWIYQIYSIQISVEKNENNNAVVSVIDRGTGISLESLKSICNVGQSYFQERKRREEIEKMPVWLRPTANFGIGLQSCFMVTDKITIYTNSDQDSSYKMIFKSGKQEGYVNVESLKEKIIRGSKVEIEILDNYNFSYSMWGYTANKLMRIEPFETNCIVIYKVIETIFEECDSSFFEINIRSSSTKFSDVIHAKMSDKKSFPTQKANQGYYYLLSDDCKTFTCWYKDNLYRLSLKKHHRGTVAVKFKGKTVKKHRINEQRYVCFEVDVDLYSYSAKEALSLNRERLNSDVISKVCNDIDYLIGEFLGLLIDKREDIRSTEDVVDGLLLTAQLYGKEFPKSLSSNVSNQKNIRVISYEQEVDKYEVSNCSLFDIVKDFPKIPYIKGEVVSNPLMEQTLTEKQVVELLNNCSIDKDKYKLIIIDSNLKRVLSIMKHDLIYIHGEKDLGICMVNLGDDLYQPDEHTRECLIRSLVYRNEGVYLSSGMNVMRRAIPAFEEFAKLAIELKDIFFVSGAEHSKWKVISPITIEDAEKMREYSKESFVEYIVKQGTFLNLVQYVLKHGKYQVEEITIIEEYKRLISVYYELVKSSSVGETTNKDEK